MNIDHVHFYVEDVRQWCNWFVGVLGFDSLIGVKTAHTATELVGKGEIVFALSSPLTQASPVAQFLRRHPPGVADICFEVTNLAAIIPQAEAKGATITQPIEQLKFEQGEIKWSRIAASTDLHHSLIERTGIVPRLFIPGVVSAVSRELHSDSQVEFTAIDHIVLNVATGKLASTVSWYEEVLGFKKRQSFNIRTANSALHSQVMVHPLGKVKLPINEPASANSQIQEFLDCNRGAGVQHLALKTNQITKITEQLRQAGLPFLCVPHSYYQQLKYRYPQLPLSATEWEDIMEQQILVDYEGNAATGNKPLLLQIFSQPIFGEPTFFFEIIERRFAAKGFGEGNFRALFQAIEQEQRKRGSLN